VAVFAVVVVMGISVPGATAGARIITADLSTTVTGPTQLAVGASAQYVVTIKNSPAPSGMSGTIPNLGLGVEVIPRDAVYFMKVTDPTGYCRAPTNPLTGLGGAVGLSGGIGYGFYCPSGPIPLGGTKQLLITIRAKQPGDLTIESYFGVWGTNDHSWGECCNDSDNRSTLSVAVGGAVPLVAKSDLIQLAKKNPGPGSVNVLANDQGSGKKVTQWTKSQFGGVMCNKGTGVCRYAPGSGFPGNDSFQYTVRDGGGHTAKARVFVRTRVLKPGGSKGKKKPAGGCSTASNEIDFYEGSKTPQTFLGTFTVKHKFCWTLVPFNRLHKRCQITTRTTSLSLTAKDPDLFQFDGQPAGATDKLTGTYDNGIGLCLSDMRKYSVTAKFVVKHCCGISDKRQAVKYPFEYWVVESNGHFRVGHLQAGSGGTGTGLSYFLIIS
jgi:hypothetical protein